MTQIDLNSNDWLVRLQTDDHAELVAARTALHALGRQPDDMVRVLAADFAQNLQSDERTDRRTARHALVALCNSDVELVQRIMPMIVAAVLGANAEIRHNARSLVATLMERHGDSVALHDALRPSHLLVTPMSYSPVTGWHCVMTYQEGKAYYSDKPRRRTLAHNVLRAAHAERFRYGVDHLATFVVRATLAAAAAGCVPAQQSVWLMQKIEARGVSPVLPPAIRKQLMEATGAPPSPPRAIRKDLLPKGGAGLITINDAWC